MDKKISINTHLTSDLKNILCLYVQVRMSSFQQELMATTVFLKYYNHHNRSILTEVPLCIYIDFRLLILNPYKPK